MRPSLQTSNGPLVLTEDRPWPFCTHSTGAYQCLWRYSYTACVGTYLRVIAWLGFSNGPLALAVAVEAQKIRVRVWQRIRVVRAAPALPASLGVAHAARFAVSSGVPAHGTAHWKGVRDATPSGVPAQGSIMRDAVRLQLCLRMAAQLFGTAAVYHLKSEAVKSSLPCATCRACAVHYCVKPEYFAVQVRLTLLQLPRLHDIRREAVREHTTTLKEGKPALSASLENSSPCLHNAQCPP